MSSVTRLVLAMMLVSAPAWAEETAQPPQPDNAQAASDSSGQSPASEFGAFTMPHGLSTSVTEPAAPATPAAEATAATEPAASKWPVGLSISPPAGQPSEEPEDTQAAPDKTSWPVGLSTSLPPEAPSTAAPPAPAAPAASSEPSNKKREPAKTLVSQ